MIINSKELAPKPVIDKTISQRFGSIKHNLMRVESGKGKDGVSKFKLSFNEEQETLRNLLHIINRKTEMNSHLQMKKK
jgi:stress response protein SCP2